MTTNISTELPVEIYAGDAINATLTLPDHPASKNWRVSYNFMNQSNVYHHHAASHGDQHVIDIKETVTAAYMPGRYEFVAFVKDENGGNRSILCSGIIRIKPNPESSSPHDGRSFARRMLDAIESAIMGRANKQQLDLIKGQFADQSVEIDTSRLLSMRDRFQEEVNQEDRAKNGVHLGGKIYAR